MIGLRCMAPVSLQKSDLTGAADVIPEPQFHHSQPQAAGQIAEAHDTAAEIAGEYEVDKSHRQSAEEQVSADVLPELQIHHSQPREPKVVEQVLEQRVSGFRGAELIAEEHTVTAEIAEEHEVPKSHTKSASEQGAKRNRVGEELRHLAEKDDEEEELERPTMDDIFIADNTPRTATHARPNVKLEEVSAPRSLCNFCC